MKMAKVGSANAEGRFGMYAQLAEALDDRLKRVEIVNGIGSIAQLVRSRYYGTLDSKGVIMPGMLQYFDLSDLTRWKQEAPASGRF